MSNCPPSFPIYETSKLNHWSSEMLNYLNKVNKLIEPKIRLCMKLMIRGYEKLDESSMKLETHYIEFYSLIKWMKLNRS